LKRGGYPARLGMTEIFAHVDRGRVVEAGMRLARGFDVAQRLEKPLIFAEDDAHAQAHAGQAATTRLGLDRRDQALGQPEAARLGPNREPAEIEVALL